jgi:hypothetical protein
MNNYGVVVNEIGMESFMSQLQRDVTRPLSALFYPAEGTWVDTHHSFSVSSRRCGRRGESVALVTGGAGAISSRRGLGTRHAHGRQ